MLTLLRLPFQTGLGAGEWSPLRSRPYAHFSEVGACGPLAVKAKASGGFRRRPVTANPRSLPRG
jgi:hypothetical protein